MTNPHRVRVFQQPPEIGGFFVASCAGCDWQVATLTYSDAGVRGVTHQVDHANDRPIYRRTDWTEPVEDT